MLSRFSIGFELLYESHFLFLSTHLTYSVLNKQSFHFIWRGRDLKGKYWKYSSFDKLLVGIVRGTEMEHFPSWQ